MFPGYNHAQPGIMEPLELMRGILRGKRRKWREMWTRANEKKKCTSQTVFTPAIQTDCSNLQPQGVKFFFVWCLSIYLPGGCLFLSEDAGGGRRGLGWVDDGSFCCWSGDTRGTSQTCLYLRERELVFLQTWLLVKIYLSLQVLCHWQIISYVAHRCVVSSFCDTDLNWSKIKE